jgi:hypothetical protein
MRTVQFRQLTGAGSNCKQFNDSNEKKKNNIHQAV